MSNQAEQKVLGAASPTTPQEAAPAKKSKAKAAVPVPISASPGTPLVATGSGSDVAGTLLDGAGTPAPAAAPAPTTPADGTPGPSTEVPIQQAQANPPRLKDNHHTYLDATGFEYDLTLVRTNLLLNSFATYRLRLYESNTIPHTYCTYIQYAPPKEAQKAVVQKNGVPILAPV